MVTEYTFELHMPRHSKRVNNSAPPTGIASYTGRGMESLPEDGRGTEASRQSSLLFQHQDNKGESSTPGLR